MGFPPAPTELLPGWRSANSTGPETKPPPSPHNQREREKRGKRGEKEETGKQKERVKIE